MKVSKEEVKEMIDNVILSDGIGQITGLDLNEVLKNVAHSSQPGRESKINCIYECYRAGCKGGWGNYPQGYKGEDTVRRQHNVEVYNRFMYLSSAIGSGNYTDEELAEFSLCSYITLASEQQLDWDFDHALYQDRGIYHFYDFPWYCENENGSIDAICFFNPVDGANPMIYLCEDGTVMVEYAE